MMSEKDRVYRAYLLRYWCEASPGTEGGGRFSVEEVFHRRRRRGFGSLEALIAFLRAELSSGGGPSDDDVGQTESTSSPW
jgi:hypothetical protein